MDIQLLCSKFARMGADVRVRADARLVRPFTVDVKRSDTGQAGHRGRREFFEIAVRSPQSLWMEAIAVEPRLRHLVLSACVVDESGLPARDQARQNFLCGHDERAWFVAAVPPGMRGGDVRSAMEALKPREATWSQAQRAVKFKDRNRRRNAGFVRQGEWFFIPRRDVVIADDEVQRDEPLVRSGLNGQGKPHRCQFLARTGGEVVYVRARPSGGGIEAISVWQHQRLASRGAHAVRGFLQQRRNMAVFVKGRISHADHKTIVLKCWHEVAMNTENQAPSMRNVAFID
jgi:hypothetical protein